MKLTVLNSGSSGNGYVLEGRNSALIIECGVPPKELFKLTSLPISKVSGCLVSHEHIDHAKYAERYAQLGLRIFASTGTINALSEKKERSGRFLPDWKFSRLIPLAIHRIGEWVIYPFDIVHDAAEPLGFIIEHRECGRILFLTDTSFCKYNFQDMNLDHIMIEANYDDGLLNDNIASGVVDASRGERTRKTHLSIRQACDLIKSLQTADLKTIILIHLSQDNADADYFARKAAETALFAKIGVAVKGFTIELNKKENFAVL